MDDYPLLYVDFLYLFNREHDYYECHEALEELWLEEGRERFYQGLLQVSVGLYHFENGNVGGAKKLFASALKKFAGYPGPFWMGIHLRRLINEVKDYFAKLNEFESRPFSFYPLCIEIVDHELKEAVERRSAGEK
jgi:predicted metal-dependent hydrolase